MLKCRPISVIKVVERLSCLEYDNKTDITLVLLKKGADVNQRDDDGG